MRQGRRWLNEWHVVRVPDPERWGTLPPEGVLGVQDLPAAVARIGLRPGDPVFVAPDGMVDPDLLDFVRSHAFRNLGRETKRTACWSGWCRLENSCSAPPTTAPAANRAH
jgi:hypothetical protein